METLLVRPRTEKELAFVKTVLEYGKVRFDALEGPAGKKPSREGDVHWPVLDAKLREARAERERGEDFRMKAGESLDDFMERALADGTV